jgi:hypothetical protein
MAEAADGRSLFHPTGWVRRFLDRIGMSADSEGASRWAALVLGAVVLVPPFVLSAWRGTAWGDAVDVPFMHDFDALARLVVVVPLLVLASRAIGAQLASAMLYLEEAALVPDADRPDYEDAKSDLQRRAISAAARVLLLVLAFVVASTFVLAGPEEAQSGLSSWMFEGAGGGASWSPAGWWYGLISAPLVAFLLLLWAWRYVSWCLFIRRLGRMDLRIAAAHPDMVGGLAPLARAHAFFVLVGVALSAIIAGALADELLHAGTTIAQVGPEVAFFVAISLLVLAAPLAVFVPTMLQAKGRGVVEYGRMGIDLAQDFDARWEAGEEAKLLDTADPSAMADFSADYGLVHQMKVFPLGLHQIAVLGVTLFVPFAFLVLTQVSLSDLLRSLIEKVL